jgi:ArpU family phage transcriptional regulator
VGALEGKRLDTVNSSYHEGVAFVKNIKHLLPPIDEEETREKVEKVLAEVLLYRDSDFERKEATITASYELRESQRTNETSDQTANIAIANVEEEERRERLISRVEWALRKLSKRQRELITERYLTTFDILDKDVYYGIMGISWGTYDKIRTEAFYLLAFHLKLYVVKEVKNAHSR